MTLDEALSGVTKIGIDTAPLIYYMEQHPRYAPIASPVFSRIADGRLVGVTTVITLVEVLTLPLQQGDPKLADAYKMVLDSGDNLIMVAVDPAMAVLAAELRAKHGLRTPDAIQIAASLNAGCEAFLTNDKRLSRVQDLRVVVLDDLDA